MDNYEVGDEVEIVYNDGYFYDRIRPGMKAVVSWISSYGSLEIRFPTLGGLDQNVSEHRLDLIRKVKKEKKKSGFAKFISRIDASA